VQARIGRPQVAYRESITRPVGRVEYRYVKTNGWRGQYGHVIMEMTPVSRAVELSSKMLS